MATAFLFLFLFVVVSVSVLAAVAEAGGCTDELISFSACLAYVSSPPNNLTETASANCCDAFSSGVNSLCLCHLIRHPRILGFPLNITRLLSLSSLCPSQTTTNSFYFLCSASSALPPLNSAETLGIMSPPHATAAGTGSHGAPPGRMAPTTSRGAETAFYFPSLNGSTHKSLLLSQVLAIFVALALALLNNV